MYIINIIYSFSNSIHAYIQKYLLIIYSMPSSMCLGNSSEQDSQNLFFLNGTYILVGKTEKQIENYIVNCSGEK